MPSRLCPWEFRATSQVVGGPRKGSVCTDQSVSGSGTRTGTLRARGSGEEGPVARCLLFIRTISQKPSHRGSGFASPFAELSTCS